MSDEHSRASALKIYEALSHNELAEIAYAAHLYAFNTVEAGRAPPVGAWNREEWLFLKRVLEEAGLNCTPSGPSEGEPMDLAALDEASRGTI